MNIELYVAELAEEARRVGLPSTEREETLEEVLKGTVVELWFDGTGERFWLVADEADAVELGKPRGSVYTTSEARRLIQVGDPETVAEVHRWKKQFNAIVREYIPEAALPGLRNSPEKTRRT